MKYYKKNNEKYKVFHNLLTNPNLSKKSFLFEKFVLERAEIVEMYNNIKNDRFFMVNGKDLELNTE